mmetsp:Transcript_35138/g.83919  ORF Transcript_35138/g.83919 Transcript_35138/m.83919 type:complete len:206 (+) Transcript_35138:1032-1649(+)
MWLALLIDAVDAAIPAVDTRSTIASSTGCCTPTQNSTPPSLFGPSCAMGVMKSRLVKREPSTRKLVSSVSDSCRASSAPAMCEIASSCSADCAGASPSRPRRPMYFVCRNRQLRPRHSSVVAPDMALKPADAKTMGLRSAGVGVGADGSVTRQLSSENLTKVYRSQSAMSRDSICFCMYGSERCTSRKATAVLPFRAPWQCRGMT